MKTEQLLEELIMYGGAIVRSCDCSEMEIANAEVTKRFAISVDNLGYVRRTAQWLELQKKRELEANNLLGK